MSRVPVISAFQDNWIVPCNVVGLKDGDTGKKKQQKRPIRFLVHPETLRLASYDKNLSARIGETAKEVVGLYLFPIFSPL